MRDLSNLNEHALRNEAIAEAVYSGNEVIAISLEQVQVDFKGCVAHLKHLSHIVAKDLILNGLQLLRVDDSINVRLTRF